MTRTTTFFFFIFLWAACNKDSDKNRIHTVAEFLDLNKTVHRIAFGSCNDQDDPQNYWSVIDSLDPDLWIWMGDNIYADTEDMSVMKTKYLKQLSHKEYEDFRHDIPIIGTWDDHDYGINDGNKNYKMKAESKTLMLDFLNVSDTMDVRKREGVYQSFLIGGKEHQVKVILLDLRTFQDPLERNPKGVPRYFESEDDMLGEAQWQWLNEEMKGPQSLNIIVSSLQFVHEEQVYEKWANFPVSRNRMIQLLRSNQDIPVVFLSGDRHIGEVSRMDIEGLPYPLYDITSSGLTHSYEDCEELNSFRISPLVTSTNFGILDLGWSGDSLSVSGNLYNTHGDQLFQQQLLHMAK